MFCIKCGQEIEDGAAFCRYCGTATAGNGEDNRENAEKSDQAGKKSHKVLYIASAAGVLLAVIIGGIFLLRGIFRGTREEDMLLADGKAAGSTEDENWQDLEPLYEKVEVPVIDIHAVNYTAREKSPGIVWDSTLFYWLEDVDQESSEDGYLAKCPVGRMLFRSAENGSLIQYEIYRDPGTGEIYKIVSVEQGAEELHLTDYYYQNGNPNFTFSRNDSVYTPTYATTDKTGERYYFDKDVMARWRMIEEPRVIEEYVLTLNDAYYSQYDYYEQSGDIQRSYDETESRELNAARNTFDAVTAAEAGIGLVEGRVIDASGNPLAGMTVDILREENGTLLYRGETEKDGSFQIYVHLEDVLCRVVVRGNKVYASNSVEAVELSGTTGGSSCGSLLLNRIGGEEYPVHINVYDAVKVRTEEGGSLIRELLPGAKVSLRAGAGVRTGEVLQTLEADEAGEILTVLPAGTYTAQIDVPGYVSSYVTVEVAEKETEAKGYVLPAPEEGQTGIVLSWEGEADLDLTLFTPYQSTDGDMAHIGGSIAKDSYGNRLVSDNTACCEVMYVNTSEAGSYKLYVNNYTQSEAENYSSGQLGGLNVHIYIYDRTGLLEEFSFPAGESGVVWEVAEINGGRITPAQRVYRNLAGKNWWTQSKYVLDMEENIHFKHLMESMVLAAWGNNNYDEYGYSSNTVNSMQAWADELYRGNWENMGDWLGTVALSFYPYPKTYYIDREDMPYIDEIMTSSDVAEILQNLTEGLYSVYENGWLLKREQLAYLAYAASGSNWNQQGVDDVMNAHPCTGYGESSIEQIGESILFGNHAAGLACWVYLENITTKYEGSGYWSVTAECFYEDMLEGGVPLQMANATFHVKRNPDSCFDGYSIIGMDLVPIDNTGWKQAYIDLIKQYEAGQYEIENENFSVEEFPIEECSYSLINFDNKGAPELVIEIWGYLWGYTTWLYTYDNDTLYKMTELDSGWHDHYEYIDGKEIVVNIFVDGAGTVNYYEYYQIDSNNQLVHIYEEALQSVLGDGNDIRYYYGDTQITKKEYETYYEQGIFKSLGGSSSASEIINEINSK